QERPGEYVEDIPVREEDIFFMDLFIVISDDPVAFRNDPHGFLYLRELRFHRGREGRGSGGFMEVVVVPAGMLYYAVDAVCMPVIAVKAQLVRRVQYDQPAGCQPERKAQYVDRGVEAVPGEVPECRFEVVGKHANRAVKIMPL